MRQRAYALLLTVLSDVAFGGAIGLVARRTVIIARGNSARTRDTRGNELRGAQLV